MRTLRTRRRVSRRVLAVLAAAVVTGLLATPAAATPFPAQHFALAPVGDEPLQKGFVEVIHPEGPEIYARHEYVLNGAGATASYEVVILIWTSSLACAGDPTFVLPVAVVVTNGSGNGSADAIHSPELLDALGLRGVMIGGNVTLYRNGTPAYTTGCKPIQLD